MRNHPHCGCRVLAAIAVLTSSLLAAGLAGCTQSSADAKPSGVPTQPARVAERPTASDIQARIQQVQADPKMSGEQKALLVGEMQHALNHPAAGPAPITGPGK